MGYCLNKNCANFNMYMAGSKPHSYSIVVCKRCNEPLGMNNYEKSLENNINKLKVRFPEKFTEENAINRNLEEERKQLEN